MRIEPDDCAFSVDPAPDNCTRVSLGYHSVEVALPYTRAVRGVEFDGVSATDKEARALLIEAVRTLRLRAK